MSYRKHITHLKKHRNVLYGIVVLLLVLQVVSFLGTSSQVSKIVVKQDKLLNQLEELDEGLNLARQEAQFGITSLAGELITQKSDIQNQINLLKSSRNDFSGVIEEVIVGVVSIITDKSAGSGFIATDDGYIITNYHVISDAQSIKVQTYDGAKKEALLVGYDSFTDLAVLKIDGTYNSIELENSDNIQLGEKVIAIGNPLGLQFTITEGIVSALKRTGPNQLSAYIQSDVTLNPGNSGGPLINKNGKVVGVNNFKLGNAEAVGFALESNLVKEKVNEIVVRELI